MTIFLGYHPDAYWELSHTNSYNSASPARRDRYENSRRIASDIPGQTYHKAGSGSGRAEVTRVEL
jgi:hypothetical protein